jgi:hypothetical protein
VKLLVLYFFRKPFVLNPVVSEGIMKLLARKVLDVKNNVNIGEAVNLGFF